MKKYSRVRAVIDLDAIKHNIDTMHANLTEGTKIMAVVKTDGYGHGAVPIARMMEEMENVWGYAVATLDEGVILRRAGIKKPILCLGCIFPDQFKEMIEEEIRMTTSTFELAEQASDVARQMGKNVIFHLKIDTGMSRLGFPVNHSSVKDIMKIAKLPFVELEGMFTHFAKADELEKEPSNLQLREFMTMKEALRDKGLVFPLYHCSNSAGILDMPETDMDLVRAGIATYGLYPSEEVNKEIIHLKPAMELIAHVTHVKWIEPGTPVSYGWTYRADRRTKVATIPMGYGDGYPRSLSNKGYVLIHGKRAEIIGRVCMDQFMVDVTDIEDVKFGDKVTLIGKDQGESIPVEELGDLSGRFNYEFICDLNKRVPREYIMGGKIVEQTDCFG